MPEATTASRLLTLLSLLQGRRDWPGAELADRLDVSPRTVRRDVERLRDLGYPVQSLTGPSGGYTLHAGTAMPPLLLDDDEAIAIAVGLRTAARSSVAGIEETSVRALVKLEQVLPAHLRRRVQALQTSTVTLAESPGGPLVDPQCLTALAARAATTSACASPIAGATAPRRAATSSRTRSSTSGAGGTSWPGTPPGWRGARSASTGSPARRRRGRASSRARSRRRRGPLRRAQPVDRAAPVRDPGRLPRPAEEVRSRIPRGFGDVTPPATAPASCARATTTSAGWPCGSGWSAWTSRSTGRPSSSSTSPRSAAASPTPRALGDPSTPTPYVA
jgi:biotin operon repressor